MAQTILEDNADYTITRYVNDASGPDRTSKIYKRGPFFHQQEFAKQRVKLRAVVAGTQTLTAAEQQRLLAMMALLILGDD